MPDPLLLSPRQVTQPWTVYPGLCECQCGEEVLAYEFVPRQTSAAAQKRGFFRYAPTTGGPSFEPDEGAYYLVETVEDVWSYSQPNPPSGKPPDTGSGNWSRVTTRDRLDNVVSVEYSGSATETTWHFDDDTETWQSDTESGTVDPDTGVFDGSDGFRASLPFSGGFTSLSQAIRQRSYSGNAGSRTETTTLSEPYTAGMLRDEHAAMLALAPIDTIPEMAAGTVRRVRKVATPTFPLEQNWTEAQVQGWIDDYNGWIEDNTTALGEAEADLEDLEADFTQAWADYLAARGALQAELTDYYEDMEAAHAAHRAYVTWTRRAERGQAGAQALADAAKAIYDAFIAAGVPEAVTDAEDEVSAASVEVSNIAADIIELRREHAALQYAAASLERGKELLEADLITLQNAEDDEYVYVAELLGISRDGYIGVSSAVLMPWSRITETASTYTGGPYEFKVVVTSHLAPREATSIALHYRWMDWDGTEPDFGEDQTISVDLPAHDWRNMFIYGISEDWTAVPVEEPNVTTEMVGKQVLPPVYFQGALESGAACKGGYAHRYGFVEYGQPTAGEHPRLYRTETAGGSFPGCPAQDLPAKSYSGQQQYNGTSLSRSFSQDVLDSRRYSRPTPIHEEFLDPGEIISTTQRRWRREVQCGENTLEDLQTLTLSNEFTVEALQALVDAELSAPDDEWPVLPQLRGDAAVNYLSADGCFYAAQTAHLLPTDDEDGLQYFHGQGNGPWLIEHLWYRCTQDMLTGEITREVERQTWDIEQTNHGDQVDLDLPAADRMIWLEAIPEADQAEHLTTATPWYWKPPHLEIEGVEEPEEE
jgi:hypothetical protein